MIYPNAQIPLIAEPIHRSRNGRKCHRGHFCCAKAGVSRRKSVMPLWLLSNYCDLSIFCSRNTACGHGDFCSVRLNGPIWGGYPYAVIPLVAEPIRRSRNGRECYRATFAAQKQESPDAKVPCPSGCCRIIKAYRYCQSQQFCYVRRKYVIFQIVPKREGSMNTQNRRHDIYSSQVYRCASLLNEFKP